jgi:hypothetical protein
MVQPNRFDKLPLKLGPVTLPPKIVETLKRSSARSFYNLLTLEACALLARSLIELHRRAPSF